MPKIRNSACFASSAFKSLNFSQILENFAGICVRVSMRFKSSVGNLPFYLGILHTAWEISRLFINCTGSQKVLQNIFQTVQISLTLFINSPDFLEIIPDCREVSTLPRNLSDCREIFQTVQKFSKL